MALSRVLSALERWPPADLDCPVRRARHPRLRPDRDHAGPGRLWEGPLLRRSVGSLGPVAHVEFASALGLSGVSMRSPSYAPAPSRRPSAPPWRASGSKPAA